MSTFTSSEIDYLNAQMLGRLATSDAGNRPHVVPVGFRYNPETETIDIGGRGLGNTKKYRDAGANPHVAFVVDDLASTDPWRPRGIEVRGRAELFESGGENIRPGFDGPWMRITPRRIVAWGLDTDPFEATRRTVG